jgi:hypothetical protein
LNGNFNVTLCSKLASRKNSLAKPRAAPRVDIMANYYHEARAHAKNIKHMQDDNRRRAERRAEKAGVEVRLSLSLSLSLSQNLCC